MARTEIIEFLKNNEREYTSKEISKILNIHYRSVARALSKMLYTKEIEIIIRMREVNNKSKFNNKSIKSCRFYKYKRE